MVHTAGGKVMSKNIYESPFNSRYSSKEMLELFSPDKSSEHGESFGLL